MCCSRGGGQELCAAKKPQGLHLALGFPTKCPFQGVPGGGWVFFRIYHLVKGRMPPPLAAVVWPSEGKAA